MIIITLYTSRIVLETLGITDFGIYNVVASVVTMLGFISSAMISATQRFLSFELGKNNTKELSNTFIMSVNINVIILIVISIAIEIIGLWLINNELNIPPDRLEAAIWAFQCSLVSFGFSVLSIPYNANIIAHEKLNIYAIISIIDAILKLSILFLIENDQIDKLKAYSFLMVIISASTTLLYLFYNRIHFPITKFRLYWNDALFKKLLSYTGWNFFGALAGVCTNQFSNILINIFFGPAVNASKAIASQINSAIYGFVTSIQLSMSPQIVKSYSIDNKNRTKELIFIGSKYSYFFILLLSAPIIFKIDLVLSIWLSVVPSYTAIFSKLVIIESLIISLSSSLMSACNATGKIKIYQIIVGSITLSNIPISFFALKQDAPPEIVFYISICLSIMSLIARLLILKKIDKSIIDGFEKKVIFRIASVSLFSISILYLINDKIPNTILGFLILSTLSSIIIIFLIWFMGISKKEKLYFSELIRKKTNLSL